MVPMEIQQSVHHLSTRRGYIVDARIGWWKVQSRGHAMVLTAIGDLDGSNTDLFDHSIRRVALVGDPFVIDMSAVSSVGVECFESFKHLDQACRKNKTPWTLIAAPALPLLTHCGGGEDALPLAESLSTALRDLAVARPAALRLCRD